MEPFKQSFININFIDMIGLEMKKRVQWESPPPWITAPQTIPSVIPQRLLPSRQLPPNNSSMDNYFPRPLPPWNPPRKVVLRFLPPRQLPLSNAPLSNYLNNPPHQVPLWITIEKCFQLSCFESELYLSTESIATGDPIRGGIVTSIFWVLLRTHS